MEKILKDCIAVIITILFFIGAFLPIAFIILLVIKIFGVAYISWATVFYPAMVWGVVFCIGLVLFQWIK